MSETVTIISEAARRLGINQQRLRRLAARVLPEVRRAPWSHSYGVRVFTEGDLELLREALAATGSTNKNAEAPTVATTG